MERRHVELWAPGIGANGVVIAYGHYGRPLLAFPTERGRAWEYENGGMVGAIAGLIEAGRVKLYCVDSYDEASWSNADIPLEDCARAHGRYEAWILE
jgi:esterase/lipase superfamily enzyme